MYVYMYIRIYIYIYVYIYIYPSFFYIYTCAYVYIYIYMKREREREREREIYIYVRERRVPCNYTNIFHKRWYMSSCRMSLMSSSRTDKVPLEGDFQLAAVQYLLMKPQGHAVYKGSSAALKTRNSKIH